MEIDRGHDMQMGGGWPAAASVDISIIIVIYNSLETIERSVASVLDHFPQKYSARITVVDNGSTDTGAQVVSETFPEVAVISTEKNLGFGRAANIAMAEAPGRYYYLHQSDAYLQSNVLDQAFDYLEGQPDVGVAGLPLVFPDHSPQTAAYAFSSPWKWFFQGVGVATLARWMVQSRIGASLAEPLMRLAWGKTYLHTHMGREGEGDQAREVDWVCGAAMILRDEVRQQLNGGFDPRYFLYGEDEDLCIEARKHGWRVEQLAVQPVIHDFGWGKNKKTSPRVIQIKYENLKKFIDKHFKRGSLSWSAMRLFLSIKHFWWRVL